MAGDHKRHQHCRLLAKGQNGQITVSCFQVPSLSRNNGHAHTSDHFAECSRHSPAGQPPHCLHDCTTLLLVLVLNPSPMEIIASSSDLSARNSQASRGQRSFSPTIPWDESKLQYTYHLFCLILFASSNKLVLSFLWYSSLKFSPVTGK